nr:AraC family transcriptional regulator [Nocardia brasiliensis]
MSICVGAFVLARAGLLDDRPATTHWAYCDEFADLFPAVKLDPAALYVDDGDVLTSAGLSAGFDLCLHIARRELGVSPAAELARWNVTPPHRSGGQAQYIPDPLAGGSFQGGLAATLAWVTRDPAVAPDVSAMAAHALMSERTFIRRFKQEVGTTPRRWLDAQHTVRARELLETRTCQSKWWPSGPVSAVSPHCGRICVPRPVRPRRTIDDRYAVDVCSPVPLGCEVGMTRQRGARAFRPRTGFRGDGLESCSIPINTRRERLRKSAKILAGSKATPPGR